MDLGAYAQIGKYSQLMEENGIEVPRLRGLRLMAEEDPLPEIGIEEQITSLVGWGYFRKEAEKRVRKTYDTFNKYCGREDVLYIHARIGNGNWKEYGGPEIEKAPWFIEKVDDAFDETYCDIYARIKNEQ